MKTEEWTPITPVICDMCNEPAVWKHSQGGFRCGTCERPGDKTSQPRKRKYLIFEEGWTADTGVIVTRRGPLVEIAREFAINTAKEFGDQEAVHVVIQELNAKEQPFGGPTTFTFKLETVRSTRATQTSTNPTDEAIAQALANAKHF